GWVHAASIRSLVSSLLGVLGARGLELGGRFLPPCRQLLELVLRGGEVGEQLVAARRVGIHRRVGELCRADLLLGLERLAARLASRAARASRSSSGAPRPRVACAPCRRLSYSAPVAASRFSRAR